MSILRSSPCCRWSRSHLQEYTILKHWPWCSHSFGLLTVEHNLVEPARSYIRELLEAQGYLFHSTANVDDWCVELSSSDDSEDEQIHTLIPVSGSCWKRCEFRSIALVDDWHAETGRSRVCRTRYACICPVAGAGCARLRGVQHRLRLANGATAEDYG